MRFASKLGTCCERRSATVQILCRVFPVFLLALVAFSTLSATSAEAQSYRFGSVVVEGNARVDGATIANQAAIPRGRTISAGQLNDAYQRVLGSGLFESVEFTPRGGTLVITVVEYPTINRIRFEGNRRIDDDDLAELTNSSERRIFVPGQAERDASLIADAYAQRGRVAATVTPRIIRRSDNRVDLIFEILDGGTVEVERVSFVGNRIYSDRRLRRVLETKQAGILRTFINSDTLIEDRIEFDKQVLRDFYLSRGYIDFRTRSANVEFTRERDAFFLVVNVEEGQQFRFGQITTRSELPNVDANLFQSVLRIKPGVVYSPSLVENSIARQERLGIDLGIDFLRVEPRVTRNDRDLTLDVEFVLTRGERVFIERIDIEGNTTTLDRVVRQQFKVVEGDPFNPREIRQAAERIRALGYFASADVDAREGTASDQVIVDLDVEEQPTGSLNLGGTFSSTNGFGLAIGLTENNFLGRGQRLSLQVSSAEENSVYTLGFTEPYLLGRDLEFNLGIGYSESDSSFYSFDTKQAFFSPSLSFPVSENSRVSLRYSWRREDMIAREVPNNGIVVGNEIALGERDSSSLGVSYTYDSRLTGLNPNAGLLVDLSFDYGGIGGDNQFMRAEMETIAQTKIFNEEVTLRATFKSGALAWRNGFSRSVDRFQLGPDTFRGFEPGGIGPRETFGTVNDPLGGNLYAVAQLEAEFPLGLPEELGLRGALFWDIGNLWDLENANTAGVAAGTVLGAGGSFRHVIGFGLLWDTPVGPLRLNFTNALKKEQFDREQSFDLTISARF